MDLSENSDDHEDNRNIVGLTREATIIEVLEAEKETVALEETIKELEIQNDVDESDDVTTITDSKSLMSKKVRDKYSLLLYLCLLTFEADLPEQFYDALFKSNLMAKIMQQIKGEDFRKTSTKDLC